MPPRRNGSLRVLLLVTAAVVVVMLLTDWPPWTVILGGVSLAVEPGSGLSRGARRERVLAARVT